MMTNVIKNEGNASDFPTVGPGYSNQNYITGFQLPIPSVGTSDVSETPQGGEAEAARLAGEAFDVVGEGTLTKHFALRGERFVYGQPGNSPDLFMLRNLLLDLVMADYQGGTTCYAILSFDLKAHQWSPIAKPYLEFRTPDGVAHMRFGIQREHGMPGNLHVWNSYEFRINKIPFESFVNARLAFFCVDRTGWWAPGQPE